MSAVTGGSSGSALAGTGREKRAIRGHCSAAAPFTGAEPPLAEEPVLLRQPVRILPV